MNYVIDSFARPPVVVIITDDDAEAARIAEVYANQVGHDIVVTTGPSPTQAQFSPVIPDLCVKPLPDEQAAFVPTKTLEELRADLKAAAEALSRAT